MQISAVIIAFNEEAKIADAIRSVSWATEVIVVDSESTDRTREIAAELGARVIVQPWLGFGPQKQFAVDSAANNMIFSLDADEVASDALASEIRAIDDPADGYRIPRLATYLGREVRHSGWYPDWQLRLFDRRKGKWKDTVIHESFEMQPGTRVDSLKGDIFHFSADGIAHHAEMIQTRYAPLSARAMYDAGRTTSALKIAFAPPFAFINSYLIKLGFLDGFAGLAIAYFAAYNVFLKNVLLWEMRKRGLDGEKAQHPTTIPSP